MRSGQHVVRQYFEGARNAARQKFLLAAKVLVKRGSRHRGSSNDFSYRDLIVPLGCHELGKRPQHGGLRRLRARSDNFDRLSGRRYRLSVRFT